jgi:DNA-binding IclR family transcriptional regulator
MNLKQEKIRQGIQSIEVGARLLEALVSAPRALMLRDLAAAADMAPAKAYRYLVSFMRVGLVEQESETGRYTLGAFSLQLGLSSLARMEPVTLATPILRDLGERIRQTVAIAVWGNQGATIVRWFGSNTPVSAGLRLGSVMPLTRSATGAAFLAFLPEATTIDVLRKELADNNRFGLSPASAEEIEPWLRQTRRHGLARTSDFIPGISGMAAPVFDCNGSMALALIALGYTSAFDMTLNGPIAMSVLDIARQLSWRLGFARSAA